MFVVEISELTGVDDRDATVDIFTFFFCCSCDMF